MKSIEPDISRTNPTAPESTKVSGADTDALAVPTYEEYLAERAAVTKEEAGMAFDFQCRNNATVAELRADVVLQQLRKKDEELFAQEPPRLGYGVQAHPRFAGDHFLTNAPLIEKTNLLEAARRLPKGAHLHIHYNACLPPSELLKIAKEMDHMYISSDLPLVELKPSSAAGAGARESTVESRFRNFFLCEIQFSILSSPEKHKNESCNMFEATYVPRQWMQFKDEFFKEFKAEHLKQLGHETAMEWLESKLVFSEKETYDISQTPRGAWERFNGRTRMMKGLFNYESAYRRYTKSFLESLLKDNIQYAEIRPNFMLTNQLWNDTGTEQKKNKDIVSLIIDEVDKFKKEQVALANNSKKPLKRHFDGIKIIYCTPRSFSPEQVECALTECLEFKKEWPKLIAGFDLVGEEAQGHALSEFVPAILKWKKKCLEANHPIPLLLHCGETLDMGSSTDGNLFDALLLKAKRIGHGFALPRHPRVLDLMIERRVCVEVCPISNEILGLTPRVGGHAAYSLLARNLPCVLSSDNGTLFRSSLAHDFYQVFVGKADMSLFGWRQLAEWSIEHSCLEDNERQIAYDAWIEAWREYVVWLLEKDEGPDRDEALLQALRLDNKAAAKKRNLDGSWPKEPEQEETMLRRRGHDRQPAGDSTGG